MTKRASIWEEAVAHAGLEDHCIPVLFLEGEPPGGPTEAWAVWVAPKQDAQRTPSFPLTAANRAEVNDPSVTNRYRVIAFSECDDSVLLGFLRHELEHIRQFDVSPSALWMSHMTHVGFHRALPDLAGGGRVYNLMPRELDANGAARRAIEVHEPRELQRLQSTIFAALVRNDVEPDPGTIFFRSFCFSFLFENAVRAEFSAQGEDLDDFLRGQNPAFLEAWEVHRGDTRLGTLVARRAQLTPTRPRSRRKGRGRVTRGRAVRSTTRRRTDGR